MSRLTERQREVLGIIEMLGGSDGYGEIWTHYDVDWDGPAKSLAMRNFDLVCDALKRKGMIDETDGWIDLTDVGRAALKHGVKP